MRHVTVFIFLVYDFFVCCTLSMIKIVSLFLLIALVSPAYAGAQTFVGPGRGVFVQSGSIYPCEQIFLDFSIEDASFSLSEGGYICGLLQASYDSFVLGIDDGLLLSNGEVVGDINEDELNLYHNDPSDNSDFLLRLRFLPDGLEYLEIWKQNGIVQLEVTGMLRRLDRIK